MFGEDVERSTMNRQILRLAIPNILSNVSIPLLSTVDTALMGRQSSIHLGAIGVGAMIFNIVYWNFGFLRMGTTGITAQAYGKQDDREAALTAARALVLALIISGFILLFWNPVAGLCLRMMNVTGEQSDLANRYLMIRVWDAPATLMLYALMGWFFGMQNSVFPLLITLFVNVINILVSFTLVQHYGWGVDGIAIGTVVAQYAGFLLAVTLFLSRYRNVLKSVVLREIINWVALRGFLTINRDIFIRTVCLSMAFGFFYSQSSSLGTMVLAVNVILLQFISWMSYGVDGLAFASESLVGKFKGSQDEQNLRKAIRYSFCWSMGLATAYSMMYFPFGRSLLSVFTNQQDVIEAALPFLFWMVLFPPLATPCYLWDGVFIGLTQSKAMRNSMLISLVVFLLAVLATRPLGNHGLWAALLLFMVTRGAIQWYLFSRMQLTDNLVPMNRLRSTND